MAAPARRPGGRPRRRSGRRGAPSGLHALAIAVGLAALAVVLLSLPSQESAAVPRPTSHAAPLVVGGDASWPNCRASTARAALARPAFAIVGVNDGVPGTVSGCLGRTMTWAATATGGPTAVGYYVMAADPWQPAERRWAAPRWPSSEIVAARRIPVPATYGTRCDGTRTNRACAYLFGWSTARFDATIPGVARAATSRWWIDVETLRDFSDDPLFNQAIIEGMAAYFAADPGDGGLGASTGIYSNPYFWSAIVGETRAGGPLDRLDEWYPIGADTPAAAAAAAADLEPFTTHGRITLVQVVQGGVDVDVVVAR